MRPDDEFSITEAIKQSLRIELGSRFELMLVRFVDHLHDYADEVNFIHSMWMGVLNFLYDCGKISTPERREFILLSKRPDAKASFDLVLAPKG